ncbi:MAG: hydroxymethylglutaryl-CoA reductase, degradative [Candidatus Brockarchaeota archaeon]|nr:hydroxymethylglutaryl-CoA reductase, degradative [Candidatus Brockarchaeota archaeon]MBO3808223.1 hydroxymethylglutaryl-CoA reductase, degradative [Candidatus Brockarchaeota archaeon]
MRTSRIPGFYNLSVAERLGRIVGYAGLMEEEAKLLSKEGNLSLETADRMVENVIGTMAYPFSVALNFLIDGKEYIVPMVIEETSVVAAASNAAKMTRAKGGIFTDATEPIMIGQVQLTGVTNPFTAKMKILEHRDEILKLANDQDPVLVKLGGGARDVEARVVDSPVGPMVITHLLVDVRDAMGANAVNTMCEAVAPLIEKISGGKVYLRIISNLADRRLVRARTTVAKEEVGGEEGVDAIVKAWAFAASDSYRAVTHNKGIMNGVIAVALATGQDHRALEAGAHAYASRVGRYLPLSVWEKDENGDLTGTLEMPMAVGLIGGATKTHPVARIAIKILGVKTATELARVMGAVGLAQNLAALRALALEGIQAGHMKLHARNIAVMAGATGGLIEKVAEQMIKERKIRFDRAQELVKEFTEKEKQ